MQICLFKGRPRMEKVGLLQQGCYKCNIPKPTVTGCGCPGGKTLENQHGPPFNAASLPLRLLRPRD